MFYTYTLPFASPGRGGQFTAIISPNFQDFEINKLYFVLVYMLMEHLLLEQYILRFVFNPKTAGDFHL